MASIRLIGFAVLVACTQTDELPVDAVPEAPVPSCGAADYQDLVGRQLAAVSLPDTIKTRVVRPDEFVTMEYVADRMTIELDEAGAITAIRCG